MKEIQLNQSKLSLVDDEDFEGLLKMGRWSYSEGYVQRKEKGETLRLHRFLLGMSKDDTRVVDHINGDGLDNRKSNLRICTKFENSLNKRKHRDGRLKHKGIYQQKSGNYSAKIQIRGNDISLGTYKTQEEAGKVYERAEQELFGEFARKRT